MRPTDSGQTATPSYMRSGAHSHSAERLFHKHTHARSRSHIATTHVLQCILDACAVFRTAVRISSPLSLGERKCGFTVITHAPLAKRWSAGPMRDHRSSSLQLEHAARASRRTIAHCRRGMRGGVCDRCRTPDMDWSWHTHIHKPTGTSSVV